MNRDERAACNIKDMPGEELRLTLNKKEVTCGRCLRIMRRTKGKY